MLRQNKIDCIFISVILVVYLFTRASDMYALFHLYPTLQQSFAATGLTVAKFFSGIAWLNNNMLSIHDLHTLGQNGNLEIYLGKLPGYGNFFINILCLSWVIYLTFSAKEGIKSTQILLLAYMLFAFVADFFCFRWSILLGEPNAYMMSNPAILAGIFVLAHGCEIIRELTYSNEAVKLIKKDVVLILLISIVMLLLCFQFNMPLVAYPLILLLHLYSSFTVSKRKIFQGKAAMYIKTATVLYIFVDMTATIFFLNHDAAWIKSLVYLIDYSLYPFTHILFICSEYVASETNFKNNSNKILHSN